MACCVLSLEELGQLKYYGITPNHSQHPHITNQQMLERLAYGILEIYTTKDGVNYLYPAFQYYLSKRHSNKVDTIQRVIMAQPIKITIPI
jgi:hypothetical protein